MINHPSISVLFESQREDAALSSLISYLNSLPHVRLSVQPHLPRDLTPYNVVASCNESISDDNLDTLTRFVEAGAGWLALVDRSEKALPSIFGVQPEPVGPSPA